VSLSPKLDIGLADFSTPRKTSAAEKLFFFWHALQHSCGCMVTMAMAVVRTSPDSQERSFADWGKEGCRAVLQSAGIPDVYKENPKRAGTPAAAWILCKY
jgi:hypothetical protein